MIEKLVLLISKKILLLALTMILAVVVTVFGNVIFSVPSFGVAADNTLNVLPPSVLKSISTVKQFIGDRSVLLTLQVMVWVEPEGHDTAVLGAVTRKGPAVPTTLTAKFANSVCPTLGVVEL
jgi:uncharacterized membrane protein